MTQQFIVEKYIFNATAKTITFPNIPDLKIEGVQLVTNLTTGTLIYQFNDVTKKGTVSGDVLTLVYDTTTMANTDKLQILYNPPTGGIFDRVQHLLSVLVDLLRSPPWMTRYGATDRLPVQMDVNSNLNSVTTVSAVSSVTGVTNITNIGSIGASEIVLSLWETEYNTGIRNKIV